MRTNQALLVALVASLVAVTLAAPIIDVEESPSDFEGIDTSTIAPHISELDAGKIALPNGGCLNPGGSPCACSGIPSDNQYYLTSFDDTDCACGKCNMYGAYFAADKQR